MNYDTKCQILRLNAPNSISAGVTPQYRLTTGERTALSQTHSLYLRSLLLGGGGREEKGEREGKGREGRGGGRGFWPTKKSKFGVASYVMSSLLFGPPCVQHQYMCIISCGVVWFGPPCTASVHVYY